MLRLVSLPMWFTISAKVLNHQLAAYPQLQQPLKVLQKRRKKEAKLDSPPRSSHHERSFIPELLKVRKPYSLTPSWLAFWVASSSYY